MDAGGIKAAKPHYDKAGAKYRTLVDPQNSLTEAFGFDVIPNGFLIDEAGVLRYKKIGGFEVKSQSSIKAIEEFLALPPVAVNKIGPQASNRTQERSLRERIKINSSDGEANLKLGKLLLSMNRAKDAVGILRKSVDLIPNSSSARFNLGSALLAIGDTIGAGTRMKEALRLDRNNFVIRKQIWLIEHPEKFHPNIDWGWQGKQLKKEREQEKLELPSNLD